MKSYYCSNTQAAKVNVESEKAARLDPMCNIAEAGVRFGSRTEQRQLVAESEVQHQPCCQILSSCAKRSEPHWSL